MVLVPMNLVNGDIFEGQHTDGFAHGHGTMRYKSESKVRSICRELERVGKGMVLVH